MTSHVLASILLLICVPSACSDDAVVADVAMPITIDEVVDACQRYCRRAAACEETVDESSCTASCQNVAGQAIDERCEDMLYAALDCLDRNVCMAGLPGTPSAKGRSNPCSLKVAGVDCVFSDAAIDPAAFGFFGTGAGLRNFLNSGYNVDGCGVQQIGGLYDGWGVEIRCRAVDDRERCSCEIDQRVTKTFENTVDSCPLDFSAWSVQPLVEQCGWRY